MNELNLIIEESTLTKIENNFYGSICTVETAERKVDINCRRYDKIYNFFINEVGVEGSSLTLISDNEKLLALKSTEGTIAFISDAVTEDCKDVRYLENEDYIKNKYGLTKYEFLCLAKKEINSKKYCK